jgi:gamma-glutamylcyclotransferase (GGCT)/AIG2-like uncharacterized protein YtfP
VQVSTFGRRLHGEPDALVGFESSLVKIDDPQVQAATAKTHHANATANGMANSRVAGMVFEVSEAELRRVDEYEKAFSYKRIDVKLASGRVASVYIFQL